MPASTLTIREAIINRRRFRFLGLTTQTWIQVFFGASATVSIVILLFIVAFLFKEAWGFNEQNNNNIEVYRKAGLEYVDLIDKQVQDHTALNRRLQATRLREFNKRLAGGETPEQVQQSFAAFDEFASAFNGSISDLQGSVSDLKDAASANKEQAQVAVDMREAKELLLRAGKKAEADKIEVPNFDFKAALKPITDTFPLYQQAAATAKQNLENVIAMQPAVAPVLQPAIESFKKDIQGYIAKFPAYEKAIQSWNPDKPVGGLDGVISFFTDSRWLTASFWQDYYGIFPLFMGSLTVSVIALIVAIPLGVAAAIYVNQVASPKYEQWIKPFIEFIAAFPSVVLGFFGIAVLGQSLRLLSQQPWMAWFPGFPFPERLNATTAGLLLGLMAIPTIFSLAEDAINNVPRHFKEASFALGATRLQTVAKIIVPASLSGIISAVLLGFGRVIGETMVVLLCAGNRIEVPDFAQGISAFFQPVHTMTGIIAQEMGEVPRGSIHFRALFMVGITLFFISLLINYLATLVVRKFKISIG
jgi:phosphate transport system permease protein